MLQSKLHAVTDKYLVSGKWHSLTSHILSNGRQRKAGFQITHDMSMCIVGTINSPNDMFWTFDAQTRPEANVLVQIC